MAAVRGLAHAVHALRPLGVSAAAAGAATASGIACGARITCRTAGSAWRGRACGPALQRRPTMTVRAASGAARGGTGGAGAKATRTGGRALGIALFSGIVAGTAVAGVWQARRYYWKVELIEAVQARLNAPPVDVDDTLDPLALYMRRIRLRGHYLHEHEIFVGPRSPPPGSSHTDTNGEKSGFMVFTPFVTESGLQVIVNRGWVPRRTGRGDGVSRPTGEMELLAVVREHEERKSNLVPDNDMSNGQVFWADVPLFAQRAGFTHPEDTCLIDAVAPWQNGQFPLPRGMKSYSKFYVTPFKHVVYATTWFSLAVAGSVMTFIKFRRGGR